MHTRAASCQGDLEIQRRIAAPPLAPTPSDLIPWAVAEMKFPKIIRPRLIKMPNNPEFADPRDVAYFK
jgi:hypothetical protein